MPFRMASNLRGTTALIGVCVAIFIFDLLSRHAILLWGALSPDVWAGQWHRLLAPNFIHSGITHLLFNMYALYIFGRIVEGMIGTIKFVAVFFISGLVGFAVSLLANPGVLAVGASAALFGLMGYTLHFRIRRLPLTRLPMDTAFIQIFVINLFVGFMVPNIDHFAHLGGLIGGILAGGIVGLPEIRRGFTINGVEPPQESPSFIIAEKIMSSLIVVIFLFLSVAPLSFGQLIRSDQLESALEARYGSFFTPFRAVNGAVFWLDSEKPENEWQPIGTSMTRSAASVVSLGFYWRWESGAAHPVPTNYEVHWQRRVTGGGWETVHVNRGRVDAPDSRRGYIYRRGVAEERAAGDFDGDWRVLLYVDGREQLKELFKIGTQRRTI